jgi:precorrin-6x reductase
MSAFKSDSSMPRVLVFGGTTEGREIAEWLSARGGCEVFISSLTEFGSSLVQGLQNVTPLTGRLLPDDIEGLLRDQSFSFIVDATHPYAAGVSTSIAGAAEACAVPLYRVLREDEPEGPWNAVDSPQEAARYVANRPGRVLLTTGSKDLPVYAEAIDGFAERVYARVLPVASSLEAASGLGLAVDHIIAMKGPFSKELNCALIRDLNIAIMVTKASGTAGGFWEKVEAARECGIDLVVIHRPSKEEGFTLEQLKDELEKALA